MAGNTTTARPHAYLGLRKLTHKTHTHTNTHTHIHLTQLRADKEDRKLQPQKGKKEGGGEGQGEEEDEDEGRIFLQTARTNREPLEGKVLSSCKTTNKAKVWTSFTLTGQATFFPPPFASAFSPSLSFALLHLLCRPVLHGNNSHQEFYTWEKFIHTLLFMLAKLIGTRSWMNAYQVQNVAGKRKRVEWSWAWKNGGREEPIFYLNLPLPLSHPLVLLLGTIRLRRLTVLVSSSSLQSPCPLTLAVARGWTKKWQQSVKQLLTCDCRLARSYFWRGQEMYHKANGKVGKISLFVGETGP